MNGRDVRTAASEARSCSAAPFRQVWTAFHSASAAASFCAATLAAATRAASSCLSCSSVNAVRRASSLAAASSSRLLLSWLPHVAVSTPMAINMATISVKRDQTATGSCRAITHGHNASVSNQVRRKTRCRSRDRLRPGVSVGGCRTTCSARSYGVR